MYVWEVLWSKTDRFRIYIDFIASKRTLVETLHIFMNEEEGGKIQRVTEVGKGERK